MTGRRAKHNGTGSSPGCSSSLARQTHRRPPPLRFLHETNPKPAILLKPRRLAPIARIKPQTRPHNPRRNRHHVPDIERNNVCRQHVNVVGRANHLVLPIDKMDRLNMVFPPPALPPHLICTATTAYPNPGRSHSAFRFWLPRPCLSVLWIDTAAFHV
jgi:hypothetical protein